MWSAWGWELVSNQSWVWEAVLSVGQSSGITQCLTILGEQLSIRLVVVLLPQVQDFHNRGTFAMLLLARHVPGLHPLQLR